ncbi:MAG: hydrolase, partial [Clostridiaceae bacterium]|nr:hydrolase [Clostridiaceae bacterium]
ARTVDIVGKLRAQYPDVPIIATGGPSDETILETIKAGANAITVTPPTSAVLVKIKMDKYRLMAEESCKGGKELI